MSLVSRLLITYGAGTVDAVIDAHATYQQPAHHSLEHGEYLNKPMLVWSPVRSLRPASPRSDRLAVFSAIPAKPVRSVVPCCRHSDVSRSPGLFHPPFLFRWNDESGHLRRASFPAPRFPLPKLDLSVAIKRAALGSDRGTAKPGVVIAPGFAVLDSTRSPTASAHLGEPVVMQRHEMIAVADVMGMMKW